MEVIINWRKNIKGVYTITNLITQQVYVGSTKNGLYKRMCEHRRHLRKGIHVNKKLQNSFNKYGEENFSFKYKEVKDVDSILIFEQRFIDIFKPYFNMAKYVLDGGKPNKGKKLNQEWKNNLVKSREGYKHSEEVLKHITSNNKNNSVKLIFKKEKEYIKFNSWVEASTYFKTSPSVISNAYKRVGRYKGYSIEKENKQSKRICVDFEEGTMCFDTCGQCDRYLNLWKGATSFYTLRDGEINENKSYYQNI